MLDLKLFKDLSPRRISIEFKSLPDISDSQSPIKGKIVQLKDITNLERQVIVNFDLEGRLLDIELGAESLDGNVKILERSFDGKFYLYFENCKNLKSNQNNVYRYYDYYHQSISEELKISKILVDSVTRLLKEISQAGYKSNKKIMLTEEASIKRIPLSLIKILEKAYKKYNWEGLIKNKLEAQKIYSTPISVLPPEVRPDQNPIFAIIQLTHGCKIQKLRGPCKFCNSYRDVSYKEKNIEELRNHIANVKRFIGQGWKYVKKIFLSDADPLYNTEINSETYFKFLRKELPNINWYECFISTFGILSKSKKEWEALKKLGLRRLYWGVESANNGTLKILGKPHNKKMLYKAASILNRIKIPYVVILLSGIANFTSNQKKDLVYNPHIKETAKFIQDINCSNVYISRFTPQPDTEIYDLIKVKKLTPPSLSERELEHRTMIKAISYSKENPFKPVREVKGTYGAQFNR
jgi:radical SAM superfamily enzyme YgiQ (UPF0313 family)